MLPIQTAGLIAGSKNSLSADFRNFPILTKPYRNQATPTSTPACEGCH